MLINFGRILRDILTHTWIIILLIISCFQHSTGERRRITDRGYAIQTPVILNTTPSNYSFHTGDLAIMLCAVQNLGTKTVVWRKASDPNPLTVGTYTYVGDPRFQIHHVVHKDQWNLHIRNVSMKDAGVYECQVSTVERDIRRHYQLDVVELKSAIHIIGTKYVEKGQKLELRCNATGNYYPPDELDWFVNGIKIVSDRSKNIEIVKSVSLQDRTIISTLIIKHAQMKDAATYVCRTSENLVTNFRVNVLNAGTYNVKRGTVYEYVNGKEGDNAGVKFQTSYFKTLTICIIVLLFR